MAVAVAMGKAVLVVIGTVAVARFVVPRVLGWVDASRSREVFLLAILSLCIGTAWLTSLAGLSLALGAFLGGMVVAGIRGKGAGRRRDSIPLLNFRGGDPRGGARRPWPWRVGGGRGRCGRGGQTQLSAGEKGGERS